MAATAPGLPGRPNIYYTRAGDIFSYLKIHSFHYACVDLSTSVCGDAILI